MKITIQPDLELKLWARAETEGLTVEAYIERIARDDQEAEEELAGLALDGVNSGASIEPSREYWEEKRRRFIAPHEEHGR